MYESDLSKMSLEARQAPRSSPVSAGCLHSFISCAIAVSVDQLEWFPKLIDFDVTRRCERKHVQYGARADMHVASTVK